MLCFSWHMAYIVIILHRVEAYVMYRCEKVESSNLSVCHAYGFWNKQMVHIIHYKFLSLQTCFIKDHDWFTQYTIN